MQPEVFICTPCKDGTVDVNYATSLLATGQVLTGAGIKFGTAHICSSSIDNARSVLATLFMKSKYTHLLFIDDDMSWAADLPLRLLQENVDMVGVPYRKKCDRLEYTLRHAELLPCMQERPWMALVECVGMGMTLISRKVFERMDPDVPSYQCYNGDIKEPQRLYFRHEIIMDASGKPHYESEDFHFCRMARAKGIDVWAYVDEDVYHIGRKAFGTSYASHIGPGTQHGYTGKRPRHSPNLIGVTS